MRSLWSQNLWAQSGTQEETTRKSLPLLGQQALPVIGAAQVHGEPGILGSFSVWVEGWFYIMFFLILESCKTSTQTPTPFWMTFTSWVNRWIFSILFFFWEDHRDLLIQSQVILPPIVEGASCNPCRNACGEVHQTPAEGAGRRASGGFGHRGLSETRVPHSIHWFIIIIPIKLWS